MGVPLWPPRGLASASLAQGEVPPPADPPPCERIMASHCCIIRCMSGPICEWSIPCIWRQCAIICSMFMLCVPRGLCVRGAEEPPPPHDANPRRLARTRKRGIDDREPRMTTLLLFGSTS